VCRAGDGPLLNGSPRGAPRRRADGGRWLGNGEGGNLLLSPPPGRAGVKMETKVAVSVRFWPLRAAALGGSVRAVPAATPTSSLFIRLFV
jgi:hypothetical protein